MTFPDDVINSKIEDRWIPAVGEFVYGQPGDNSSLAGMYQGQVCKIVEELSPEDRLQQIHQGKMSTTPTTVL